MPGCYFDVPRMRIFDSVIADVVFVKNYSGFDEVCSSLSDCVVPIIQT